MPTLDQRISALRDYLVLKLDGLDSEFDMFLEDGDDKIIWLMRSADDDAQVVVITLQEGKIEVQG